MRQLTDDYQLETLEQDSMTFIPVKLRRIENKKDILQIAILEKQSYEVFWKSEDFWNLIQKARNCRILAAYPYNHPDTILGYIAYEKREKAFNILTMGVDPKWRHHKIGTQILNYLEGKLSKPMQHTIGAEIRESNVEAQLFLQSYGFLACGIINDAYEDIEDESAYIFHYKLPLYKIALPGLDADTSEIEPHDFGQPTEEPEWQDPAESG